MTLADAQVMQVGWKGNLGVDLRKQNVRSESKGQPR